MLGAAVITVSFFESIVRDHSKDSPGDRAYVGGRRSLGSRVHHRSEGLHFGLDQIQGATPELRGFGTGILGFLTETITASIKCPPSGSGFARRC